MLFLQTSLFPLAQLVMQTSYRVDPEDPKSSEGEVNLTEIQRRQVPLNFNQPPPQTP